MLGTEKVAQPWATTVSILQRPVVSRWLWQCVESFGVLSLTPCFTDGTSFVSKPFKYILGFSSGHSSLHPFLLTGAGLDLSNS